MGARGVGLFLCPQMDFPMGLKDVVYIKFSFNEVSPVSEQGNNHLDVQCEIIEVEMPCDSPSTEKFFCAWCASSSSAGGPQATLLVESYHRGM